MMQSRPASPLKVGVISLGILIPLSGLLLLAYMGYYNRYWSDDWCYNVDFKNVGIGGTIRTYFLTENTTQVGYGYSNNRYSLTLISGLLFMLGIAGAQLTATLVIIGWFSALAGLAFKILQTLKTPSKSIAILGALFLLYYTLYLSPQRFQVLYWISGIHYSLAIIFGLCLAGWAVHQSIAQTSNKAIEWLCLPIAFLAGGFSETGCAYLLTGCVLALSTTGYWKLKHKPWAERALPSLIAICIGLFLSLVTLVASPSNAARIEIFSKDPLPLPVALLLSLNLGGAFMLDSAKSLPLPHLVVTLMAFALSTLAASTSQARTAPRAWSLLIAIPAVLFITWLLIAASFAPTAYFYGTPPDPRGQSLARFTMLAGLTISAWLLGLFMTNKRQSQALVGLAMVIVLAGSIYTVRSIRQVYAELPGFIDRATLWDQRDEAIRTALQQGNTQLEVTVIDMQKVNTKDIMSSNQMNGEWVSTCASKYYGLNAIKAVAP